MDASRSKSEERPKFQLDDSAFSPKTPSWCREKTFPVSFVVQSPHKSPTLLPRAKEGFEGGLDESKAFIKRGLPTPKQSSSLQKGATLRILIEDEAGPSPHPTTPQSRRAVALVRKEDPIQIFDRPSGLCATAMPELQARGQLGRSQEKVSLKSKRADYSRLLRAGMPGMGSFGPVEEQSRPVSRSSSVSVRGGCPLNWDGSIELKRDDLHKPFGYDSLSDSAKKGEPAEMAFQQDAPSKAKLTRTQKRGAGLPAVRSMPSLHRHSTRWEVPGLAPVRSFKGF